MEQNIEKLIEYVRENPDLLPRLLLVADQSDSYRIKLESPQDAAHALIPILAGFPHERTAILGLNSRMKIIDRTILTVGNDSMTIMCTRQIYRWALGVNAKYIVLGHNHPSGCIDPSIQDKDVTRVIDKAGKAIGIKLLDHIIVGGDKWSSMKELGIF